MAAYDYRTKPDTEWTFYVVDHVPTMANIYRFDTVQEAIDKFTALPDNQRSAIGSSLQNRYEIDHIHKINGLAVLVTDMDRMENPVWRQSEEITAAVSLMRSQLGVEYQRSNLFGDRGSVATRLPHPDMVHNKYLDDKNLSPAVPERPLSGINEVYQAGEGWVDILTFLEKLDNQKWSRENGYPVAFVDTLNIRYVDNKGHAGQADISPDDFLHLREKYERFLQRGAALDDKINEAKSKAENQSHSGKGMKSSERDR